MNYIRISNVIKMPSSSKCCVPNCKSGLDTNKKKNKELGRPNPSLFSLPRDPDLHRRWLARIKRSDRQIIRGDKVCELHFDQRLIETKFATTLPNGNVWSMNRLRPILKPGAIPTIFPNSPSHLSSPFRMRRPPRDRSNASLNVSKIQSDQISDTTSYSPSPNLPSCSTYLPMNSLQVVSNSSTPPGDTTNASLNSDTIKQKIQSDQISNTTSCSPSVDLPCSSDLSMDSSQISNTFTCSQRVDLPSTDLQSSYLVEALENTSNTSTCSQNVDRLSPTHLQEESCDEVQVRREEADVGAEEDVPFPRFLHDLALPPEWYMTDMGENVLFINVASDFSIHKKIVLDKNGRSTLFLGRIRVNTEDQGALTLSSFRNLLTQVIRMKVCPVALYERGSYINRGKYPCRGYHFRGNMCLSCSVSSGRKRMLEEDNNLLIMDLEHEESEYSSDEEDTDDSV